MRYLWNKSKKLAEKYKLDEVNVFITINVVCFACLFLLGYGIAACIIETAGNVVVGVGGICTVLTGCVIGLFGSVFWMLRNEIY